MDLISRGAAIEALEFERDCLETPERINGVEDAIEVIQQLPTVPAVPLDKLCLLLHDIAGSPCYTQPGEDMCNQLIGDQCNTEWDDVECWKRFLTKWMEEQDINRE